MNLLAKNVVPRRLNVLPNIDVNIDRSKQFIYINENDTESKKVSIRELNSYILRNGDCGPEYINNGGCSFDIGFPTSAEQRYSNELYFTLRKDEVGTLHVTVGLVFTL